jgi:hypothetical protein
MALRKNDSCLPHYSLVWHSEHGKYLQRALPQKTFGIFEVITSKMLRSPPWHGWPLWNICVTNNHEYVPLVVNTSLSLPLSWLISGFVTRLTWRVPLVEQELLTLQEELSSLPVFRWSSCYSIFMCMCIFWIIIEI